MRSLLIALFSCAVLSFPVSGLSAPNSIRQEKFEALLAGNSIVGVWDAAEYRQYFDMNGSTTYAERGGAPSRGYWRIDDGGRYCSSWPRRATETCYVIERDGEVLLWHVSVDEVVYRSTVVAGPQLTWWQTA